jgi:hypothetical protein
MARPSPITVGLAVLMAVVLAIGVFAVTRPRHGQPAADAEPAPPPPAAEPAPPPPPPPEPLAPQRRALTATPPPPPPEPLAAAADDPGAPSPAAPPAPGPRAALVKNQNERMAEADEEAMRVLSLPDATRERIHAINDLHRQRSEAAATTREAREIAQARYDELRLLLGSQGAQQFDKAERDAIRKLRGKYRYKMGQALRKP